MLKIHIENKLLLASIGSNTSFFITKIVAESLSSNQTGCALGRGGGRGCRTPGRWCGHGHDMGATGSSVCASRGGRGH